MEIIINPTLESTLTRLATEHGTTITQEATNIINDFLFIQYRDALTNGLPKSVEEL